MGYVIPIVIAVIAVSGTWAVAWSHVKTKTLEIADTQIARHEVRDEKDFRDRMDYYHQVLMESDGLFAFYGPWAAMGHQPPKPYAKERFDQRIAGIEVFGTPSVKAAADKLMRAHDLRSQPKVVEARFEFVDAVRLDVAPSQQASEPQAPEALPPRLRRVA